MKKKNDYPPRDNFKPCLAVWDNIYDVGSHILHLFPNDDPF